MRLMSPHKLPAAAVFATLCMTGCQPLGAPGNIPQNGVVAGTNTHAQITVSDNGSKIAVSNTLNTASGQKMKIGFLHGAVNPDCSMSDEKPVLKVTGQPQHGSLTIVDGESFPDFDPSSPFYKCNDTSMPGEGFYYTSQAGYLGQDSISYTIFASDGHEIDIISKINVK